MPNKGLRGRSVALVTGAGYGIGAAAAMALAEDGFDVAVTELSIDDLADTVGKIGTTGAASVAIALDVRSHNSIDQAFRGAIAAFGQLDVLVNNAGVPSSGSPAVDITRPDWDSVIGVNLTGTFFTTQHMGRHLIESGRPGAIISVASTHGLVGLAGASAYGIAKAGISHMARMLAIEWAQYGIRVNAIAPGTTQTKTRAPRLSDPVYRRRMLARIPASRFGTAEEMAAAIRYLASPQAAYITGQTLAVDGGLTAG